MGRVDLSFWDGWWRGFNETQLDITAGTGRYLCRLERNFRTLKLESGVLSKEKPTF